MKKNIFKLALLSFMLGLVVMARHAQASNAENSAASMINESSTNPFVAVQVDDCDDDKCRIPICDPIKGCETPKFEFNTPSLPEVKAPPTFTCVNPNGCAAVAAPEAPEVQEDTGDMLAGDTTGATDTTDNATSDTTSSSDYFGSAAIAGGACSLNANNGAIGFDAGFLAIALLAGLPIFRKPNRQ